MASILSQQLLLAIFLSQTYIFWFNWYLVSIFSSNLLLDIFTIHSSHNLKTIVNFRFLYPELPILFQLVFGNYINPEFIVSYLDEPQWPVS